MLEEVLEDRSRVAFQSRAAAPATLTEKRA